MLKRHVCKKIFKLFCKCLTFDPEHFLNLVLLNLPAGLHTKPKPASHDNNFSSFAVYSRHDIIIYNFFN